MGSGVFTVGASVSLHKLILQINKLGYGGIEYLWSVPGLVGGAVAMNAGRGKQFSQSIADYILKVRVFHGGEIKNLNKSECLFSYRNSIFKNDDYLILECTFKFPCVESDDASRRRQERIELCKKTQDYSGANFGSVFSMKNSRIMKVVRWFGLGFRGAHFSKKTSNWIVNKNGSYKDVIRTIRLVEFIHRVLLKKCEREIIVWK